MATFSDCPPCANGDHSRHVYHWGKRPEGVIDGDFCQCTGDCQERAQQFFERMFPRMAGPRTTSLQEVFVCPACDESVKATFTLEVDLGDHVDEKTVNATATVTGVSVKHDCVPRHHRKAERTASTGDGDWCGR